jgi:hypothetical protein
VRKVYNKRKFGQHYQVDLKRLSKELLVAKQKAQETFLHSVLHNKARCWIDVYKYVKRRKGNTENIPVIKALNGRLTTEPTEKDNTLNSYYVSVFSCECTNSQIQSTD